VKLLSVSNFESFKQLTEVTMFLESIQKLAEVKTEKKKNMKKYKKKKSLINEEEALLSSCSVVGMEKIHRCFIRSVQHPELELLLLAGSVVPSRC
jgi:ERCC4-type nuclease